MKLNTTLKLAGIGALLCMPAAFAQAHTNMKVNVPFTFSVGNQKLPAGEYRVTSSFGSQTMTIQSEDCRKTAISVVYPSATPSAPGEARVTFHVYGEAHYLAGVWSPSTGGRSVRKSAAEREAERGQKSVEMAILAEPR